ncbi:MAG: AbrB/MazE/SpoVT family DNA-binding domain-containing protein [Candidatus Woesearchaeota archaeon]
MDVFEAIPKHWGNSIGVTIPREIVKKNGIVPKKKVMLLVLREDNTLEKMFGSLPRKKSTQKIMDEIDEGYD